MPSLAPVRMLMANRQFALLWGGQTVSRFGDGIVSVALPILTLQVTNKSPQALGLVVAARILPTVVFLLIGGALTDRMSRRLAMLTSDASRSVITAILGVLALAGTLDFAELIVGALLFGTFDALFYPASTAMYPEILTPDELVRANSLRQSSSTIAGNLIGPIVGGFVAAFSPGWSFIIDSSTFVVSAGCLVLMRPTPRPEPSGRSMIHEIGEGIRYCWRTSWILWTLVVAGFANALVFSPIAILMPLLFKQVLHASSVSIGIGFAASGLGGLIGAMTLAMVPTPKHRVRVMWIVWSVAVFATGLYGLAPSVWTACLALIVISPLLMIGQIIWESLLQQEVPRELLGRVSSVDWMVSMGLAPIGVAAAGVVAGVVGIRFAIVVPAVIMGFASLGVLAFVRSMTALDRELIAADAATSGDGSS